MESEKDIVAQGRDVGDPGLRGQAAPGVDRGVQGIAAEAEPGRADEGGGPVERRLDHAFADGGQPHSFAFRTARLSRARRSISSQASASISLSGAIQEPPRQNTLPSRR